MNRYITPKKILKDKKLPIVCDIAIVCFCPMPKYFEQFKMADTEERLFLMLHSHHIMFCKHNDINFIVLAEVYGGPVAVSIVEELHYYGITCILSLGYVGSFTDNLNIGTNIKCIKTLAEEGTTPHYSIQKVIETDEYLGNMFTDFTEAMVWTTNALYREFKVEVDNAKLYGCHCVNMDTSHLFASCNVLGMMHVYFATVTDVLSEVDNWNENLVDTVENKQTNNVILGQNKIIDTIMAKLEMVNQAIIAKHEAYKEEIINEITELFEEQNICKSHDINHILRVNEHIKFATLNMALPIRLKYLISYAALLHDVDDEKFFKTENYKNASNILNDLTLSEDDVELIINMISYVSCSVNGDSIPREAINNEYLLYPRHADRLDALGNKGVIRCYQYCLTKKMPLYVQETLKPETMDNIWEIATRDRYNNYKGKSISMIDHYYDKLLQLGNFETDNEYFKEMKHKSVQPLLNIVEKFLNDELSYEYMNSLLEQTE